MYSMAVPATGGGGSGGGGSGGSGGGGGDGGDDGEPEPEKKKNFFSWKGWEERVAADPNFVYKVFIEQVIGVGASVIGDMSSRPYWGLYELDFVFSTLIVGSILNFSLMYFLAPTKAAVAGAVVGGNLFQKLVSEQTLKNLGAPGGHMFEPGFPISKRFVNFFYKGFVFAVIGLGAGVIGTSASNGLLILRKKLDPNFETQNKEPNILMNAGAWAVHMGVSSNVRYQLLNGMDMVAQPFLHPVLFKILTSFVRTGNNLLGGVSFVMLAKLFGVQESAGDKVKSDIKSKAAK